MITINKLAELLKFKSRRLRIAVCIIATFIFIIGLYLSYSKDPNLFSAVNWVYVAVIYITILPVVALINALRFQYTAKIFNLNFSTIESLYITTCSTIANMLPIPGGLVVRMANLKSDSHSYLKTAIISIYVSVFSALITLFIAASAVLYFKFNILSAIMFCLVLVSLVTAVRFMHRKYFKGMVPTIFLVELFSTLSDGLRIYICFLILNSYVMWDKAFILTAASVVGSAISLVPAGLGIREGTAALIATQIDILPNIAFIALAINRVIGLSFFLLLTIPLTFLFNKRNSKL